MTRADGANAPGSRGEAAGRQILFANLGSGSSGNASVLAWHEAGRTRAILVDLGLSPRRVRAALESIGLAPEQVVGVCLTHLDQDHFRPTWATSLRFRRIPVHVHETHAEAAVRAGVPTELLLRYRDRFRPSPEIEATALLACHDESGSVALRLEVGGAAIGLATDLGAVPPELHERFAGVSLLAIESNHCPIMQEASPRPAFLKRRIMGGRGHLSNPQAIAAIREISRRAELEHVVLLHLSRQCNCPNLVRRAFAAELPDLLPRLSITAQDRVTGPLRLAGQARRDSIAESPGLFEFA